MRTVKILSFLFTLYLSTNAQMVPQCECPAVELCKRVYQASLVPCVDACQKYTESLGADFQSLRSCLVQRKGQLDNTIECTGNSLTNACARGNPIMVKKRYSESIKITAISELNKMFNQMGVKTEIESVMATGKRFFGCLMSCAAKKSGNCAQQMGCGLDLPADSVLVQLGKQCAIRSGFDTQGVQSLCQCLAGAGIRQLANICPRIRIF